MPVPKRKTSKSRRDRRASTKFIRPQAVAACSNCQQAVSPHQACLQCGFYKGKKVLVTKLERTLKRGEQRQAEQAKLKAKEHVNDNAEQSSK
jgi:large subunit ribosomal protein L32